MQDLQGQRSQGRPPTRDLGELHEGGSRTWCTRTHLLPEPLHRLLGRQRPPPGVPRGLTP